MKREVEERHKKEEAMKREEDAVRRKEEAMKREEEERRQKDEVLKSKEELIQIALQALHTAGIPEEKAKAQLGLK